MKNVLREELDRLRRRLEEVHDSFDDEVPSEIEALEDELRELREVVDALDDVDAEERDDVSDHAHREAGRVIDEFASKIDMVLSETE